MSKKLKLRSFLKYALGAVVLSLGWIFLFDPAPVPTEPVPAIETSEPAPPTVPDASPTQTIDQAKEDDHMFKGLDGLGAGLNNIQAGIQSASSGWGGLDAIKNLDMKGLDSLNNLGDISDVEAIIKAGEIKSIAGFSANPQAVSDTQSTTEQTPAQEAVPGTEEPLPTDRNQPAQQPPATE